MPKPNRRAGFEEGDDGGNVGVPASRLFFGRAIRGGENPGADCRGYFCAAPVFAPLRLVAMVIGGVIGGEVLGIRAGVGKVQAADVAADDVDLAGGIQGPVMDNAGGRPFVAAATGAIDEFEAGGDGGFHEVGGMLPKRRGSPRPG